MHSQESSRFTAPLTQRVAEDATSRQIADAIGALWADIDSALQPVIGRRGVAALLKRTLHLSAARYAWLAPLDVVPDASVDLAQLTAVFAAQPLPLAVEAGSAFFQTFRDLLASLIGADLSERLLQNCWSTPSSAPPAQDPPP